MSKLIVKRSLELFDSQTTSDGNDDSTKKPVKQKKRIANKPAFENIVKTVISEKKRRLKEDLTEENLAFFSELKSTSQNVVKPAINEILDQNRGRLTKNLPKLAKRAPRKQETAFTEEDFKKFEAEYFVR